jgi:L-iditol 2-dehydrogenase
MAFSASLHKRVKNCSVEPEKKKGGLMGTTTMRAAVLQKRLHLTIESRQRPEPGPGEVLIRVKSVGVCGSDVHYYTHGRIGPFIVERPMILGHEMAGIVEAVGPGVPNERIGEKVAVEPGVPDRTCEFCRAGRYNLCPNIIFMATPPSDGALTDYVAVPADFAFKLPAHLSLDEGALMEPLSVGVYAIHRSGLKAGQTVVIIGAGPIGLVTLQVARAAGAGSIAVLDLDAGRLATAKKLGATIVVNSNDGSPEEQVRAFTHGRGADIVFDAAGSPKTAGLAVHLARRGGRVVMIGFPLEDNFPYPLVSAMAKETDIVTVFRYANVYQSSIDLVAAGRIDLKALITHRFPLEQTERALQLSDRREDGVIKAMVDV